MKEYAPRDIPEPRKRSVLDADVVLSALMDEREITLKEKTIVDLFIDHAAKGKNEPLLEVRGVVLPKDVNVGVLGYSLPDYENPLMEGLFRMDSEERKSLAKERHSREFSAPATVRDIDEMIVRVDGELSQKFLETEEGLDEQIGVKKENIKNIIIATDLSEDL